MDIFKYENCYKNFNGNATNMEKILVLVLIRELDELFYIHVTTMYSDGYTKHLRLSTKFIPM